MIKIYKDLFNSKDIKHTRQREVIYKILENAQNPLSAQEIFTITINLNENINLSTVYRILNLFFQKDIIVSVTVSNAKKELYEIKKKIHNHYIVCKLCEEKVAIRECPLKSFTRQIELETGYTLSNHKLELFGLCSTCRQKKKEY